MDYTQANYLFLIKKVARYFRLYGPSRTLIKVRGQFHMKKVYETLPLVRTGGSNKHVGLIGCGNFAYSNIAYYLKKRKGNVIRAAMDIDINKAASIFEAYGLDYYTDDAAKIVADDKIDLVYIASNHATHAEYAIDCLNAGKSVYIEKPHAVTEDQLARLCHAMANSKGKVTLGFNRPHSRLGQAVRTALASQSGASMLNWFVVGHNLEADHWYFKPEEGGRVLGNLCHWTDFVYHCVDPAGRYPILITPTRAEKSGDDIAVTYTFGDGTIAAITFSAKGHTFEGVRERFAAHRGDVLISMDDFQQLTIETVAQKRNIHSVFRDHGHETAITTIYNATRNPQTHKGGESLSYIWETGDLFLKTQKAVDERKQITIQPFSPDVLRQPSPT